MKRIIYFLMFAFVLSACGSTNIEDESNTENENQDLTEENVTTPDISNSDFKAVIEKFEEVPLPYSFRSWQSDEYGAVDVLGDDFKQLTVADARVLCVDINDMEVDFLAKDGINNFLHPSDEMPPSEMYAIALLPTEGNYITLVYAVSFETMEMEQVSNIILANYNGDGAMISVVDFGHFYAYTGTMGMSTTIYTESTFDTNGKISVTYTTLSTEGTTPETRETTKQTEERTFTVTQTGEIQK